MSLNFNEDFKIFIFLKIFKIFFKIKLVKFEKIKFYESMLNVF